MQEVYSIALLAYNSAATTQTFSVKWNGKVFNYTLPAKAVTTFKWDALAGGRDFGLAASPDSQTITQGNAAQFELAVTTRFNFTPAKLNMSVSGLPTGASATIERADKINDFVLRIAASLSTPTGTYPVTITGRRGTLVHTSTVQLIVGQSPSPFGGTRWQIPGVIQAENFDTGGELISYHDRESANNGGQHRPNEGVDIENTTDVGGGYNVAWTTQGEWLRYSVNVTTSGLYSLNARVASLDQGGYFHLEVDGNDVTGAMLVPTTGGWQTWTTVGSPAFHLSAGPHTVALVFDSGPAGGICNFNWLSVQPAGNSTPFPGAPITLPGVIQIEDFDNGGQNVGYYDSDSSNQGGQYRTSDGVDIQNCSDAGGGYNIGWAQPGEWLGYTVNVTAQGTYTFRARVASTVPGGTFYLVLDGAKISESIIIPETGDWQNWQTIEVSGIQLPAGQHILQVVMESGGYWGAVGNINWLSFESDSANKQAGVVK